MKVDNNSYINKPVISPSFGRYLGIKGAFYTECLCSANPSEIRFLNKCRVVLEQDLIQRPMFQKLVEKCDVCIDLSCNKMTRGFCINPNDDSWYAMVLKILTKPVITDKTSFFKRFINYLRVPKVLRYNGKAENIITAGRLMVNDYNSTIDKDLSRILDKHN